MTETVRDNTRESRYELTVDGITAFASYRRNAATDTITHTETPPALRGRGIGSKLIKGALDLIRADGRKVIGGCSFVADYLDKHPETADLRG